MPAFSLVPRLVVWGAALEREAQGLVRWGVKHTGLPAVVLAAVLLVASFRIVRHAARFAMQVAFVAALLAAATQAGWLRW